MESEREVDELLKIAKAIGYGEIPPYQNNELFTSGAFDLIVFNNNDSARNFDLLTKVCNRYEAVKADEKFLNGYFYLINQLTYAVGTTERPSEMQRILDENPESTEELRVWYREK